jgi:hypothetical protein
MPLQVQCYHCGTVTDVPDVMADKPLRCPDCRQPLVVTPLPAAPTAAPPLVPRLPEMGSGDYAQPPRRARHRRKDTALPDIGKAVRLFVWIGCGILAVVGVRVALKEGGTFDSRVAFGLLIVSVFVFCRALDSVISVLEGFGKGPRRE